MILLGWLYTIRFPTGTSVVDIILRRYGRPALSCYRKVERLHLRHRKASQDVDFLQYCKLYSVIPRFLYFKSSLKNFTHSKLYRSVLFKLLNYEIKQKEKYSKQLRTDYFMHLQELKNKVSWLDFKVLSNQIHKNNADKLKKTKDTHNKKLVKLGIPIYSSVDKQKVIINLSSRTLTDEEEEALKFGLDFSLPIFKPNFISHFLSFEKLIYTLSRLRIYNPDNDSSIWTRTVESISSIAHNTFKDCGNFSWSVFGKDKVKILNELKTDTNIVITKPDKGRGVVLLNKSDYVGKLSNLLSDRSKFLELNIDPFTYILKLEDKLNRVLRRIKNLISSETYNFLFASGSVPGILYGLPKIHKPDVPVRPILSAIGTFNYNLAKFLVPILNNLTTNNFTVKNSFSFVQELKHLQFPHPVVMASFDIKSLFTNIPLKETIDICTAELYKGQELVNNLTKQNFRSLLDLAVNESMFIFNGKFYKQVDGVAMGSPLGPTLANTFLCFNERKWLSDCPLSFKPVFYRRYVDDCFLLFKESDHVVKFLDYLNSKHPNIKFTVEIENNNLLSFLDIQLTNCGNYLGTSVYRKESFTGLGLNFLSFVPNIYKLNSVRTLLHRCYALSLNWICFHDEIDFLSKFFTSNNYPTMLFPRMVKEFLNQILCGSEKAATAPKDIHYIRFPFYGHVSYNIRNQLLKILNSVYPQISFRFVFVNPFTVGSFFRCKDNIPKPLCSNMVYLYACSSCTARYIGSSIRNLKIRVSEHRGLSHRTSLPLSNPTLSEIRNHCFDKGHTCNMDNFSILHSSHDRMELRILESLYIHKLKPSLNNYESSTKLYTLRL